MRDVFIADPSAHVFDGRIYVYGSHDVDEPPRDDEPGVLEHPQVLHHAEARHRQALLERAERLAVLREQLVEQAATGRVGERAEDVVHGGENR